MIIFGKEKQSKIATISSIRNDIKTGLKGFAFYGGQINGVYQWNSDHQFFLFFCFFKVVLKLELGNSILRERQGSGGEEEGKGKWGKSRLY